MRRTFIWAAVAVAVLGAATVTVLRAPWRIEQPVSLTATFTQGSSGVHVVVHNPNRHWGLREQPIVIVLHDQRNGFNIIRSYGPNDDIHASATDRRTIHCCKLTLLRPHHDYRFDLWPSETEIAYVTVVLARGGELWLRM